MVLRAGIGVRMGHSVARAAIVVTDDTPDDNGLKWLCDVLTGESRLFWSDLVWSEAVGMQVEWT